jgi:hypothetical protein
MTGQWIPCRGTPSRLYRAWGSPTVLTKGYLGQSDWNVKLHHSSPCSAVVTNTRCFVFILFTWLQVICRFDKPTEETRQSGNELPLFISQGEWTASWLRKEAQFANSGLEPGHEVRPPHDWEVCFIVERGANRRLRTTDADLCWWLYQEWPSSDPTAAQTFLRN